MIGSQKYFQNFSYISYEERLRKLNLTTLNFRRHRVDMIQTFKIINKIDDMKMEGLFWIFWVNNTRSLFEIEKAQSIELI